MNMTWHQADTIQLNNGNLNVEGVQELCRGLELPHCHYLCPIILLYQEDLTPQQDACCLWLGAPPPRKAY